VSFDADLSFQNTAMTKFTPIVEHVRFAGEILCAIGSGLLELVAWGWKSLAQFTRRSLR